MADEQTSEGTPTVPSPDKLLAIGAYGETVAAYRYLVLAEKAASPEDKHTFANLADEEQGHKQRLQKLLMDRYPDSTFLLSAEDKELVITGPRLLDVHTEISFAEAMAMMLQTERKVAGFYAQYSKDLREKELQTLFRELAEEGADHYQRLRKLAQQAGAVDPDAAPADQP